MKEVIHIALAIYDPKGTYSRHAGVVMASTFSNTKSAVCFHILHDETLSRENRENFILLAQKFDQEVRFVDVREHIAKFGVDVDKVAREFSRGALFRILVAELLPCDKVIYLDCDIVVNLDIEELWSLNMGENCVAAVMDYFSVSYNAGKRVPGRKLFFCRMAGIPLDAYFNSGALLINLAEIRRLKIDVPKAATEFFTRYPYCLLADQDFLNHLFKGRTLIIDEKFNRWVTNDFSLQEGNASSILHFTIRKPWEYALDPDAYCLYWKFFALTPWSKCVMNEMLEAWGNSCYTHFDSHNCSKTLWAKIKKAFSPSECTPLYKLIGLYHETIHKTRPEPFYSRANMDALGESIRQLENGSVVIKTAEELRAMENE